MIKMSLCAIHETDVSFNVYPEYIYYDCIQRKCNLCGTQGVLAMLLKENPGIDKDQEKITHRRWKYVEKEKGKKLDIVDEVATKSKLLSQYISDLQFMSLHMFNWKWHDQQFQYIKDNLQESHLLQVLDFAQNFMNELGEEPQSLHWAHTQTVIYPIVNYYKCPIDGETITHEHIMISDDLKHDKYAVKAFEDASLKSLLALSFKLKCILQFCDKLQWPVQIKRAL